MKIFILALLLLIPGTGSSAEISIGGVNLSVPSPQGFSPVTPQMPLLYEIQKQFVAPTNEEFVTFIPDQIVPLVLKDEIPDLPRRFAVQTAKSLINVSATKSDFEELKHIIKNQNDKLMSEVEQQMPGIMEKMNEGIKERYDVDLAFSMSQMIPMPVHAETDRTLAYSALVKYDMKDENGNPASFVAALTATFAHVKGKILFLYSYAGETDLEWSRDASRQWVNDIVSANPSSLGSSIKESLPPFLAQMDWGRILAMSLVGAIIGLIFGLIRWVINRVKAP